MEGFLKRTNRWKNCQLSRSKPLCSPRAAEWWKSPFLLQNREAAALLLCGLVYPVCLSMLWGSDRWPVPQYSVDIHTQNDLAPHSNPRFCLSLWSMPNFALAWSQFSLRWNPHVAMGLLQCKDWSAHGWNCARVPSSYSLTSPQTPQQWVPVHPQALLTFSSSQNNILRVKATFMLLWAPWNWNHWQSISYVRGCVGAT